MNERGVGDLEGGGRRRPLISMIGPWIPSTS
jgi:hypothetical protein